MKYLNYIDIAQSLVGWEREKFLVGGTSVRPNNVLQKIISSLDIQNVVEIGTGFGISAIAIASCSNVKKLITFDIKNSIWPEYLAKKFELIDKIEFIYAVSSMEIYESIKKYDFDLAYIDGCHKPPFPDNDFAAVKHIGRVLFDDAYSNHIRTIIDFNKGIMVSRRFGYWSLINTVKDYSIMEKIRSEITSEDNLENGKLIHDYSYLKSL